MSREQRDRIRKSLADDLHKAGFAARHSSMDQKERWDIVAHRIELMIDAAVLAHESPASTPETRSALSEPCDKCAGHHDIGNPCPAEACPTCKRIYCECPTANRGT